MPNVSASPSTEPSETTSLLATFFLREAAFALPAGAIQEVIRLGAVTPVRHGPPEVAGVINLRGRIVTLLDTGLILGLEPAVRDRESRIFVIEERGEFLSLLVDRVGEVIDADPGRTERLPLNIAPAQARYCTGVYRYNGRVITLLHTPELLAGVLA